MNPSKPPDILPEPPDDLKQLSARLLERICTRIRSEGPISFAAFMEMALYEPGLGYYSAGLHKFGPEGDFVTAPELGGVFGACLSRQIAQVAEALGAYDILEIGAGNGRLAAQILSESSVGASFSSRQPAAGAESRAKAHSYKILERSADLKAVQKAHIEAIAPEHAARVEWVDAPPDAPWRGIIIANEVVDALSVERFRIKAGDIFQVCVDEEEGALRFCDRPAPEELAAPVRKLGPLPDGYCSEINLLLAPWLKSISESLESGVALFIDYGYPRDEYYLPERRDGTVIAHYRHRAHNDILRWPGLQDLTAFVDFTALRDAGAGAGMELLGYTSQAMFLMSCGLDEVVAARLSGDTTRDMRVNNEVRQLVMPGLMGEKFQVMALGRDWSAPLRGFSFRDLSDRL
jgi:SAM-dependent MidA family methyltransferase